MQGFLSGKRVLITGVGFKPVRQVFTDITTGQPSHTSLVHDGQENKANIGAATALECAREGAVVHMVSRTEENLRIVKIWIEMQLPEARVEYSAVDLNDRAAVQAMVDALPTDLPLYWVQSVGLGAGTVPIKDDNPYLRIENIPPELVEAELTVLKNTVDLLQILLPRFRQQKETRVCIVSSMSAVRSIVTTSIHSAAKGAISRFANATMIELGKDSVFITDVRPGMVDTGMYDSDTVQDVVMRESKNYGYHYSSETIRCMPPTAVGKVIVSILQSEAHITSVNLVARGQFPNEGS